MSLRQFALLVFISALWGAAFLFMRLAVPEFGPFALVATRVFIATLVLVPIWYWRESAGSRQVIVGHWRQLFLLGLLNSVFPFVLFAYATLFITGGLASILNSTTSIWAVIVAWLWLGHKPSTQTVLGMLLGISGVVVLVFDAVNTSFVGAGRGVIAGCSAAIFYALAANIAAEKLRDVSPLSATVFTLGLATVVLMPFAVIFLPEQPVSINAWLAVIAMGIFSTAIPNLFFFHLLVKIGSTKTITVTFLVPIFGTLWGALFLSEQITIGMLAGGFIVLIGIALVTNVIRFGKV